MTGRVGIDIGGTFTDAALLTRNRLVIAKTRTTPNDIASGFMDALALLGERSGADVGGVELLAHGTTIATNAIVQGRTARVGLITTRGFRDVLEIGTQMRTRLYSLRTPEPGPLVPREMRLEVPERTAPDGSVLQPLDKDAVSLAADSLVALGAEAIAICFLFSFANPAHERRAAEIVRGRVDVPVTTSSDIAGEIREYPRMATTAVNASLLPLVGGYVRSLAARLHDAGVTAPLTLMRSNGGLARADRAASSPIGLIASGPAAGVIGAARLAALAGVPDALSLDVGGTTADVAAIHRGRPSMRFHGTVGGHPIALPQIDVGSIGAGGGSIARVDAFGALRVGPESAGALPGPAAYGTGGTDATVTDAHVVLGSLDPGAFLGGEVVLDEGAAADAIDRNVARPLGIPRDEAALAVIRLLSANMASALRLVSVARGDDPRRMALVALGGAGPLHACAIADEIGMTQVVVPPYPGVTSALGLLATDERHDLSRSFVRRRSMLDLAALARVAADLTLAGRELLSGPGRVHLDLDMRYRGQAYELTVPLRSVSDDGLAGAERAFHSAHRRAYGHASPEAETEIVNVRVTAIRPIPSTAWASPARQDRPETTRSVMSAAGRTRHRVMHRFALTAGASLAGPAILEQEDSTTLIPAGWVARGLDSGSLMLERTT